MKKIFLAFTATVLLLLSACGGGAPVVYMSGFSMDEDTSTANYWKDEEVSNLPLENTSIANGIFADADFTYISGATNITTAATACYWMNDGTKYDLATPGGSASKATGIYVEGSNIYVSGVYYPVPVAVASGYWMNKEFKVLYDGAEDSYVTSIYVQDGVVYTAGHIANKAVYWKGTTKYDLSTDSSMATSIKVDKDGVVYVSGYIEDKAVYWKGKTVLDVVELTDGTEPAIATSLDLAGEDVYIAGLYDDMQKVVYWKNTASNKFDLSITGSYVVDGSLVLSALSAADFNIWGPSIQTDGTTVYVSSYLVENPDDPDTFAFVGGLWKDGVFSVKKGYSYSSLFVRW